MSQQTYDNNNNKYINSPSPAVWGWGHLSTEGAGHSRRVQQRPPGGMGLWFHHQTTVWGTQAQQHPGPPGGKALRIRPAYLTAAGTLLPLRCTERERERQRSVKWQTQSQVTGGGGLGMEGVGGGHKKLRVTTKLFLLV